MFAKRPPLSLFQDQTVGGGPGRSAGVDQEHEREQASRFGILATDTKYRVTSFVEKPENPPSTLANMGVYLFNRELLDKILWEDRIDEIRPKIAYNLVRLPKAPRAPGVVQ